MIKVIFTNGETKTYRIGCKRLGALKWDHIDYRPAFKTIALFIGVDVETIEHWRVI